MTTPYPYQVRGVRKIERFGGRALLADEMGLGKSLQSLLWARDYLDKGPVVVICPAHLKWNWQREAIRHINRRSEILEGMKPKRGFLNYSSKTIFVINYDILHKWVRWLRRRKPQLIILDECHYIQNRHAKRTKATQELCEGVPHVIAVSGTPLTNRHAELFPILNLLRPDVFKSFWSYAVKFCPPEKKPWAWEYKRSINGRLLRRKLKRLCMIRRRKCDVQKELPAKVRHVVPVPMESPGLYRGADKDFLRWLRKTFPKKARRARAAERLVKMGYLKRLAATLKVKSIIRWVDDFLQGTEGKLILYGLHYSVLEPIYAYFRRQAVLVTGKVTGKKRQLAFDKFNHNQGCRLLVANMHAAGTGWSAKASTTVFVEFDWRPATHTQAEDRTHGLGRGVEGVTSTSYYLYAKGTIEDKVITVLQKKQDTLNSVLDGDEVDDFAILDLLEDLYLKETA